VYTNVCVHRISLGSPCPGVQVCCEVREEEVTTARAPPSPGPTELRPPGSCGVRGGNLDSSWFRIFSEDTFTQFGEFPWMLALLSGEEAENEGTRRTQFHCGASLIHPQVAVTTAHCVSRYLTHVLPALLSLCLSVYQFSERI
jgi:hypothetical protein